MNRYVESRKTRRKIMKKAVQNIKVKMPIQCTVKLDGIGPVDNKPSTD